MSKHRNSGGVRLEDSLGADLKNQLENFKSKLLPTKKEEKREFVTCDSKKLVSHVTCPGCGLNFKSQHFINEKA